MKSGRRDRQREVEGMEMMGEEKKMRRDGGMW
jgi:hypothetical protein